MKRKTIKVFAAWILVCLIVVSGSIETKAYFDRGPVNVSVGKSSVSIKQGQSETVSVSFSPSKSSQLPGCGMAECPQSCGEKECLDENGECTCNGTTYQTYYAFATVSSSNTSVATAEYNSGSVKISGISAGTATITVTASLRQFNSTSATIKVTVSKAAEETKETTKAETKAPTKAETKETTKAETKAPTKAETKAPTKAETKASSTASSSSAGASESVPGVTAVQVAGETTAKAESGNESSADDKSTEESGKSDNLSEENEENKDNTLSASGEESAETGDTSGITTIQSDRGTITFVPITAGKIGGEQLESIFGKKAYVDFQKKDEAGTVLYAWEFCGTDLKKAEDLDLTVEMSITPFEGCEIADSPDSLYLSFGHSGELPGTASLFIRVSEHFTDDQKLNLYSYEENRVKCLAENLAVENGYVTLTLDQCSDCILSAGTWEEGEIKSTTGSPWIWGIGAAAVICVAAIIFLRNRKGSRK